MDTMKISYSQLLNIVLVAILVSSVFFMNTRSTIETKTASAGTYDPWLDYNEDGYIGIDDIFSTASSFAAEGDPTKNVNVTNWQSCASVSWLHSNCGNSSSFSIPALQSITMFVETAGYSEIVLGVNCDYENCEVTISWFLGPKIGGTWFDEQSFEHTPGMNLTVWSVHGSRLRLTLQNWNFGYAIAGWIHYYMST
jgi:hypothetical protein